MSENKFLSFVMFEGLLFLITGLCLLILPKVTELSFGFMICLSFMFIGGYKIINAFLTRNFIRHYLLDIITGTILFSAGLILLFAQMFDIMIIIALIGIYFILQSISSISFGVQVRKILIFWWLGLLIGLLELFFGIITVITIPTGALWLVGILIGTDFIFSGFILTNMYISTKYTKDSDTPY